MGCYCGFCNQNLMQSVHAQERGFQLNPTMVTSSHMRMQRPDGRDKHTVNIHAIPSTCPKIKYLLVNDNACKFIYINLKNQSFRTCPICFNPYLWLHLRIVRTFSKSGNVTNTCLALYQGYLNIKFLLLKDDTDL